MDKQARMKLRRKAGYRDLPKPQVKLCLLLVVNVKPHTCANSILNHVPCQYPKVIECPVCKGVAVNLGRHFKPPKKSDTAQWKKVEFLIEHGFVFQKIRLIKNSYESVPYPETLAQAKEFVVKYETYAVKTSYNKTIQ